MAKVEKRNRKSQDGSSTRPQCDAATGPYKSLLCYYDQKFVHTQLNCYELSKKERSGCGVPEQCEWWEQ